MDLTAEILASVKTLQRVFPPRDSRHALNMSTLLSSAWTMLNGRQIDEESAGALIDEHLPFIQELAEVHEQDDAIECWNALLEYQLRDGDRQRLLGDVLGEIKLLSMPDRDRRNDGNALVYVKAEVERFGLKWVPGVGGRQFAPRAFRNLQGYTMGAGNLGRFPQTPAGYDQHEQLSIFRRRPLTWHVHPPGFNTGLGSPTSTILTVTASRHVTPRVRPRAPPHTTVPPGTGNRILCGG